MGRACAVGEPGQPPVISELEPQTLTMTQAMEITTEALQTFLDAGGELVAHFYGIKISGPPPKRYIAEQCTLISYSDCTIINCYRIYGSPKRGVAIER